jgi:hypothetical protein|tara:strand:+ start:42706 stop:43362 length:657 start_codon:yes stop_codon:yes gene_type:complete
MGILESDKAPVVSPATRRKSGALDFGSLKPLDAAAGTKNFGGYRDRSQTSPKSKVKTEEDMDSDADDEDDVKVEDVDDDKDESGKGLLSPEDALKQGELAEGVRKIKLKRQHSAEPLGRRTTATASDASGSPLSGTPVPGITTTEAASSTHTAKPTTETAPEASIASPFKKQRASLPGFDDNVRKSLGQALMDAQKGRGNSEGNIPTLETKMEEDEEL